MRNMIMAAAVVGLLLCTPLEAVAGGVFVINGDGTVSFQKGTGSAGRDNEAENGYRVWFGVGGDGTTMWYEVNDPATLFLIEVRDLGATFGESAERLVEKFPGRYRPLSQNGHNFGSIYSERPAALRSIHTGRSPPLTSACTVDARDLSLPLGTVSKGAFTGVGSTGGTEQSAEISITCTAAANATVRIDGTADPDRGATVLRLDGPLIGVGVKLTVDGRPVTLGREVSLGPLPIGPTPKTVTAVYVQTKNSVGPGNGNATATYSVTIN